MLPPGARTQALAVCIPGVVEGVDGDGGGRENGGVGGCWPVATCNSESKRGGRCGCADVIRSKEVVHRSWGCSSRYTSSCASPGSCRSQKLAAWDVERAAAGGCRRVRTWTRRTCSSSSSSPSPPTLTGPPGRHHTHHTLYGKSIKRESCGGGVITDFVAAAAPEGGAPDDRMYGITRP